MKWRDKLKMKIKSWLNIQDAFPQALTISETLDFAGNAIKNRVWYRGDSNELEQLYTQINSGVDRRKFWSARPSTSAMAIRKIHTGLPSMIVNTLTAVTLSGLNDFKFKNPAHEGYWTDIEKDNQFKKRLEKAVKDALVVGDGAFKLSLDPAITEYPIIEFVPGDRIDIVEDRGRVREVIFLTDYGEKFNTYRLHEIYGFGYVRYELYLGSTQVSLDAIEATKNLKDTGFDQSFCMAIPFKIYDSGKWEGRGQSVLDEKVDSFDAFDEAWSQWMDAVRAGRAKMYIPESLLPRNPETGEILQPNDFDNRYLKHNDNLAEEGDNKIDMEQPEIPHESYLATYVTALDLCLQGLISPSTLGIDNKKLDNAEAQREKEKATLYTRDAIVEALQETIPQVVDSAIKTHLTCLLQSLEDVQVDISFSEYANPSFESQVETISKGKTSGIMSTEACVDELYGDSRDDVWKEEEVRRLKSEHGHLGFEEPVMVGEDGEEEAV